MRTIPLIGCICLLLSGDIQLNPGLKCIGCVNYSPLPQDKSVKPELEWICNDCIDFISMNYDLDQSTDQYLNSLPKGVLFEHINVCGILNKGDQLKIIMRN